MLRAVVFGIAAVLLALLGALMLIVAQVTTLGIAATCKGGCPPAAADGRHFVFALVVAACVSLLAAAALVVLAVIAIVRRRGGTAGTGRSPG